MSDNPDEIVRKAHSKLKPGFFSKMLSSKEGNLEEGIDLLVSAANIYKIQKNWKKAGEINEELAMWDGKRGGKMAYAYYQEAAHCFSFVDKNRSSQSLDRAIESCEKVGKYMQAGKIAQRVANELEENYNYEQAIIKYKKAAEFYEMESQNTKSMKQQCLLKVADLMCISNHKDMLKEAPKIYENLGKEYLTGSSLKFMAKELFFKCVMIFIATKDEVSAEIALKKFILEDPSFGDSKDCKFLQNAIKCISEPPDVDGLKKEIQSYKNAEQVDKWKLNMFGQTIKNFEHENEEDLK